MKKKDIGKVAVGTALGIGMGILIAPKKGRDTRDELKIKAKQIPKKVEEIRIDNKAKRALKKEIKNVEKDIRSLEKETILAKAKEKTATINNKVQEIMTTAREREDEHLEKMSENLKIRAIEVAEMVTSKLEKE